MQRKYSAYVIEIRIDIVVDSMIEWINLLSLKIGEFGDQSLC